MNRIKTSSAVSLSRRFLSVIFISSIVFMLMASCATRKQVQEIIAQSNAAMITATIMGPADTNSTTMPFSGEGADPAFSDNEAWMGPSAKIDTFIEAHPDQKVTNSALRVRQAMLLLSYEQYNLAIAAFDMVEDEQYLKTDRDKALYNMREHLIWWFGLNKSEDMSSNDFEKADKALTALQSEIGKINKSPGIHDYLAEMRAWIALHAALNTTSEAKAKDYFEDGINGYAMIFTIDDLAALGKKSEPSDWAVSMQVVRRRLRAGPVIKQAIHVINEQQIEPTIKSKVFRKLIAAE